MATRTNFPNRVAQRKKEAEARAEKFAKLSVNGKNSGQFSKAKGKYK